jgi:hypothetical protein
LTGFKFGDYHSSQFGLIRVSNGSRYNEYLLPTLKNTTTDVPGMEGTLYFGTQKTTRSFQVDMAFDSLTEEDIRDIREWLTGTHSLVFDERPYIQYMCILNSAPQLKYLTFEENGERIYKGELSVNFVSYLPYGYSIDGKKFIDDFLDENFEEWSNASHLAYKNFYEGETLHTYDKFEGNNVYVYNGGDIEADYVLTCYFAEGVTAKISMNDISYKFSLRAKSANSTHLELSINSKLQYARCRDVNIANGVITGISDYEIILPSTEMFKIPVGQSLITCTNIDTSAPNVVDYKYRFL